MKHLYDPAEAESLKQRLAALRPDSARQWGTMTATQMVEHCARGMEMAVGDLRPPRKLLGRILGPVIRPLALKDDAPMRRNSPTVPELVIADARELDVERERLSASIARFAAAGPAGCTTYPHSFFGRMTPEQWAILMYKHLDHHLRQFGA